MNTTHEDVIRSLMDAMEKVKKGNAFDSYRVLSGVAHSFWNIYDQDM